MEIVIKVIFANAHLWYASCSPCFLVNFYIQCSLYWFYRLYSKYGKICWISWPLRCSKPVFCVLPLHLTCLTFFIRKSGSQQGRNPAELLLPAFDRFLLFSSARRTFNRLAASPFLCQGKKTLKSLLIPACFFPDLVAQVQTSWLWTSTLHHSMCVMLSLLLSVRARGLIAIACYRLCRLAPVLRFI